MFDRFFKYASIPAKKDEVKINASSTSAGYGALGDKDPTKEEILLDQHLELLEKAHSTLDEKKYESAFRDGGNNLSAIIKKIEKVTESLAEIKEGSLDVSAVNKMDASWAQACALIKNLNTHSKLSAHLKNTVHTVITKMATEYDRINHRHPKETYPEQLNKILNPAPTTAPSRRIF